MINFIIICILIIGCKTPIQKKPLLSEGRTYLASEVNVGTEGEVNTSGNKGEVRPFLRSENQTKIKHGVDKYLKNKSIYRGGFLGNVGSKKVFYADRKIIPDYDRLYWVMVGVLSEKYGCFMESRFTDHEKVLFKCRDGRFVDFHRKQSRRWVLFGARQYDKFGREIVVKDNKVIGVGQRLNLPQHIWTNL